MLTMNNSEPHIGNVISPIVVGGSIIALKCKQGVVIATDTLLSYGGLLKYPDVCRYEQIAEHVIMTATGEYSDFQQVTRRMNELTREADLFDDNVVYSVKDYANYLRNICYQKRNKQNPYYNNIVLAGYSNGETHLASVDMYGNYIAKDYVVAGFAKHFGLSLIANYWNPEISAQQCKELLHRCFSVIYERVCQSTDQIQFAVVTKDGCKVSQPEHVNSKWDFKAFRQRKNQKLWQ